MPRKILAKAGFEHAYRRLSESDQRLVDEALRHFGDYLRTGQAPVGLGIKHLGSRTCEFRASLGLRVVYVTAGETIYLALLGSHDEVRRYLKRH